MGDYGAVAEFIWPFLIIVTTSLGKKYMDQIIM